MKIHFRDKVALTFLDKGVIVRRNSIWTRTKSFNKRLGLKNHQYFAFKIPKDETTDGASIPRLAWFFISPFDWRILNPSQPHDHLCLKLNRGDNKLQGHVWSKLHNKIIRDVEVEFTQADTDWILKEKMSSYGAGSFTRWLIWVNVRAYQKFKKLIK